MNKNIYELKVDNKDKNLERYLRPQWSWKSLIFIVLFSLLLGLFAYLKKIKILEIYIFIICVIFEALVGKILADFNLPYILQPIHLLLAMISFGCMSRLLFNYKISNN